MKDTVGVCVYKTLCIIHFLAYAIHNSCIYCEYENVCMIFALIYPVHGFPLLCVHISLLHIKL